VQVMSWYRCPCGFLTETMPRFGGEIVSIMHVHRSARVDGTSALVSMVESRCPFPVSRIDSGRSDRPDPSLAGKTCAPAEGAPP
jgi:hypothetical protein